MTVTIQPEAERSVLGIILMNPKTFPLVAATLSAEDFPGEQHRRIFRAYERVIEQGGRPDPASVCAELERTGELTYVSGHAYVFSLLDGVPDCPTDSGQGVHPARLVHAAAQRRRLHALLTASLAQLEDPTETTKAVRSRVVEGALGLLDDTNADFMPKTVGELLPAELDLMLEERNRTSDCLGWSSGLKSLDAKTNGILPGELCVVGARTASGKTVLALQMALASGVASVFLSLEMTASQLCRRFLAMHTKATANPRYMTDERWQDVVEQAAQLRSKAPATLLRIDHQASMSIDDLRARARLYVRSFGMRLLVVDYLQLVRGVGKELRIQVSSVADGLRRLAKDENIGVIACSQLARSDKELPSLSHLKESGDVENAAHTVLLIHRPGDDLGGRSGQDQIVIAKQRRGPTGAIDVWLDYDSMQFRER